MKLPGAWKVLVIYQEDLTIEKFVYVQIIVRFFLKIFGKYQEMVETLFITEFNFLG